MIHMDRKVVNWYYKNCLQNILAYKRSKIVSNRKNGFIAMDKEILLVSQKELVF